MTQNQGSLLVFFRLPLLAACPRVAAKKEDINLKDINITFVLCFLVYECHCLFEERLRVHAMFNKLMDFINEELPISTD
jgi:hypothetical protein